MKQSRMTLWRHRQAERAASNTDGGLPMPVPAGDQPAKVSLAERYEYQARRRQHLEQRPGYDATWERPTPQTAAAVCALLAEHLPSLEAIHPDALTAQQLVTVALDLAVSAGRYGRPQRQGREADGRTLLRHVRRTVTRTRLFDALARRWSDHHRSARSSGRAFSVSQMARSTVEAARRDLLRQSIALPTIWNLVTAARWPLFSLRPSKREGYVVTLKRGPLLDAFERLVAADPVYGPTRLHGAWRLWVDGQDRPAANVHAPIVAERAYNVPTIGDGTRDVLKIQEDARLIFLAPVFIHDFRLNMAKRAELKATIKATYPAKVAWKDMSAEERQLRRRVSRLKAFELEFQSIYDQVLELDRAGYGTGPFASIPIRSGFAKVLNRRFQALHFGPMSVSDKPGHLAIEPNGKDYSQRRRWFAFLGPQGLEPLVDMDVSASQAQLLAVFLGSETLEQTAVQLGTPFKLQLAKMAWVEHERTGLLLHDGYTGPDDHRLVAACKNLWLRIGYGSTVANVIREQAWDPATFGPGWRDAKPVHFLLATVPGFQAVKQFLTACRAIGQQASEGLTLTDPLDGAAFTWNPIDTADVRLAWDGYEVSIMAPGRYDGGACPECGVAQSTRLGERRTCRRGHTWRVAFHVADAWPLNRTKLANMVAPCIVHCLDALFSACVMCELRALGLRDFVALHDAWYVPETTADGRNGLDLLTAALRTAGATWLQALGPVYNDLAKHLADTEWAPMIETARQKWADRVARQDWPVFSASPTT